MFSLQFLIAFFWVIVIWFIFLLSKIKKKQKKLFSLQFNCSVMLLFGIRFLFFGLLAYMTHFSELTFFYKMSFATLIILSTMICGAILEKKGWLNIVEYIRLLFALALFNTLYYYFYIDWFYVTLVITSLSFVSFTIWFTLTSRASLNSQSN